MNKKSILWTQVVFVLAMSSLVIAEFPGVAMAQSLVPLINEPLVPDTVKPGGTGFTLTVNGTGFVAGSVVHWNGSPLPTTFVSASRLKASVPASSVAQPGTSSVTVVNPRPSTATSNVLFFGITAATSSVALSAPNSLDAGSGPLGVAVGDFNGDGKLDLVITNGNSDSVSILLGKGDGTFETNVDYPTGGQPISVAVGDFNGDGKLDLATANQNCSTVPCGAGSISVLLGRGDGTFEPATEFNTGPAPFSVAVGDFNGDGKLDLAVADSGPPIPSDISILLGNGDGTFQPAVYYGTGSGTGPASVAVGDFNHDGKLDLAVANFYCGTPCGNVAVLLGKGDGTFAPAVNYSAGKQPISIAIADFNADGNLDLAVANVSDSSVSILLGNGDGTFQTPVDYSVSSDAGSIVVGDFNGDGKLDLAVVIATCAGCTDVSLLLGNGDGTFMAPVNYFGGSSPNAEAVGDFNNDGRLDIAIAGGSTPSVLLQVPTVSLSTTSLVFSNQVVGTSSTSRDVILSNTSSVLTLETSSVAVNGTNTRDFSQSNTCASVIAPGRQCTIAVTFDPVQIGARSASVTITDNAAGTPQVIAVSGTGVVSGPNATLTVPSLTFATQPVFTASPAQSITLTNYGTAALSITSIATSGDFSQAHTCGSSLAILASCTVSVTFTPTAAGARAGTLSINDNALGSPQAVSLSGTGTLVTEVQLSPTSLNFGSHPIHSIHYLSTILTNISSKPLSISSITITGAIDDFSQSNNCGNTVGPQGSCTITVRFVPTASDSDSATLSITDNGNGSPQIVTLSGGVCIPFPHRICN